MSLPRIQDILRPVPGPEDALVVPEVFLPAGAASGHLAIWDPSIGAPTCWLVAGEFLSATQETVGLVSATFLAPDVIREEAERAEPTVSWTALGAWFLGMVFASVDRSVSVLSSRSDGSSRGYEFAYPGEVEFGLLDVTGRGRECEVTVSMLRRMCSLHFQQQVGDHEAALAKATSLQESLAPRLSTQFVLRRE